MMGMKIKGLEFGHVARECQKPKRAKDAAYHKGKMLLCKQEEARIQLNAEQADWRDDTDDDELEDQELEAHYMYMAQLQEVSPDAADYGPIFDDEPLKEIDQNDDDNDLAKERDLLASLIEKLKCEIDENKNHNKLLETSNKALIEKLKERSRLSHINVNKGKSKEAFNKQTALLEKRMDESIPLDKQYEVTNLQSNYLELLEKCEGLETKLSKSKMMSKSFESVQKHAIYLKLKLQQCKEKIKNDMLFKEVEDQRRIVKLPKDKTSVTACNDNLNAKTLNVNYVCATCDKCVLIDKHAMSVLNSVAKPIKRTVASESNQKPQNSTRKQYELISKTCS
nr:hypothetical protein [Tanacetum cinerariifolium]